MPFFGNILPTLRSYSGWNVELIGWGGPRSTAALDKLSVGA